MYLAFVLHEFEYDPLDVVFQWQAGFHLCVGAIVPARHFHHTSRPLRVTQASHTSQPHEPALYHRTQSSAPQLLSSAIRAPNGSENSGLGVRRRALLLFVKGGPADAS
jgi:hypothetical protein